MFQDLFIIFPEIEQTKKRKVEVNGLKKKIEVKQVEDIKKLRLEEQKKWEIAVELGFFDRIVANGWKSLTARESGRIGGLLSARNDKKTKEKS